MYYIPDFGGFDVYFSFSTFTRNNNKAIYSLYFSNHGLNYRNLDNIYLITLYLSFTSRLGIFTCYCFF